MTNTIRILPGKRAMESRVLLGSVDISRYIHKLELTIGAGSVPTVVLHCRGIIDLPEALEALVEVEIDNEQEPQG